MLLELPDLESALAWHDAIGQAMEQAHERQDGFALRHVRLLLPAARTVFVEFDALRTTADAVAQAIRSINVDASGQRAHRQITVPVCYNGEDLDDVAQLLHCSVQHLVERHMAQPWRVAFAGFAPGFNYLTGGNALFDVPRRATPRLRVPQGAVGLAGTFSGIYPRESSGGWQLIGVTSLPMWDESHEHPALLQPGDDVQFTAVREQVHAQQPAPHDAASSATPLSVSTPSGSTSSPAASSASTPSAPSHATPVLTVIRPGLLCTYQDEGRHAAQLGVTGSGAADRASFHLANELVGNAHDAVALEIIGAGAQFEALTDVTLAIAGAHVPLSIDSDGQHTTLTHPQAFLLKAGERLSVGEPVAGVRAYLAVQGGFAARRTLNSSSTDTMSGLGPSPLQPHDTLCVDTVDIRASTSVASCSPAQPRAWSTSLPRPHAVTELTVTPGPRIDWFTKAGQASLFSQVWRVTAQSDRVGLRLAGEPLERTDARELASEATIPGSIEVTGSGLPIVFLRDQPVTGGYPVIAVLDDTSINTAAQLPAGALVKFRLKPSSHASCCAVISAAATCASPTPLPETELTCNAS
ncbi:conserved hypothetical protein TIGR00370 [Bifidobacterium gallicum DSM 20093 = LMG 11596]|nr:conserved hypothetical protein TIGR00370 [Bifidobacterium gallicum DSM 20093 = LMG 11596]